MPREIRLPKPAKPFEFMDPSIYQNSVSMLKRLNLKWLVENNFIEFSNNLIRTNFSH